jgi:hypothetical protein
MTDADKLNMAGHLTGLVELLANDTAALYRQSNGPYKDVVQKVRWLYNKLIDAQAAERERSTAA